MALPPIGGRNRELHLPLHSQVGLPPVRRKKRRLSKLDARLSRKPLKQLTEPFGSPPAHPRPQCLSAAPCGALGFQKLRTADDRKSLAFVGSLDPIAPRLVKTEAADDGEDIEVVGKRVRVCRRRPDGTPLSACVTLPP